MKTKLSKIKILLIEADRTKSEFLINILSSGGTDTDYELIHVRDLSIAFKSTRNSFDVILLDIGLLESKCDETYIRFSKHSKNIPIIVINDIFGREIESQCIELGAQDYLDISKINNYTITKSINHSIERFKLLRQVIAQKNELKQRAEHDSLTNFYNRISFKNKLTNAVFQASGNNSSLGLLFIDLDFFKCVNDNYGHNAGDILLQIIAERLTGCLKRQDICCRYGGDEFVVLLTDIHDNFSVSLIAERILNSFSRPINVNGKVISITASIGIALFQKYISKPDEFIQMADSAMYKAKKTGKNKYCFYYSSINTAVYTK
jgi:diguanylate cyclase